jgi:hypothetical protein
MCIGGKCPLYFNNIFLGTKGIYMCVCGKCLLYFNNIFLGTKGQFNSLNHLLKELNHLLKAC